MVIMLMVSSCLGCIGCRHNTPRPPQNILRVKNWVCQLQDTDPDLVASAGFDLIAMDYSRDGTDGNKYTTEEISKVKQSDTIPLAYVSIGEAENYRFYWENEWNENAPLWVGNEDPDWPGSYKVKYWDDNWKAIVYEYLDKIMEQGFSGVYLDVVDAFEYWGNPDNAEDLHLSEEEAAKRMITFLKEIAHYCRDVKGKGDFYIIPQSGERILGYDTDGSYLRTISGIGTESLWYRGVSLNPIEETNIRMPYLDRVLQAGKPVLLVEYVDDGSGYHNGNKQRIDDYRARAFAKGLIPYVGRSDRQLDELNIIEGVQPWE